MRPSALSLPCALLLASALPAAASGPGSSSLTIHLLRSGRDSGVVATLRGASGPAFLWEARARGLGGVEAGAWVPVGVFPLDGRGTGSARVPLPAGLSADAFEYRAVFLRGRARTVSDTVTTGSLEEPQGQPLDFDWGLGGVPQEAGTVVSATRPWEGLVRITADNADPDHPDAALLVAADSWAEGLAHPPRGNRAGEDLGQLLAIAADVIDRDGDGLVDVPRSEGAGGILALEFEHLVRAPQVRVFDVDEPGGKVRTYLGDQLLDETEIPEGDDLGVQYVFVGGAFVDRLEIELAGSAGVVDVLLFPCPAVVDFDETTTGVPIGVEAGGRITQEYAGLGLFDGIHAENDHPDHPDEAILFDSADPSGDDTDLATPGYGIGNDTPHRKVLIIAEDDTDLDGDGNVDEPDDEASGGVLAFGWITSDVYFDSITVVDIDENETGLVRIQLQDDWVELPLASLGDNSVQTLSGRVGPTRWIEVRLSGSGAVAELTFCPE